LHTSSTFHRIQSDLTLVILFPRRDLRQPISLVFIAKSIDLKIPGLLIVSLAETFARALQNVFPRLVPFASKYFLSLLRVNYLRINLSFRFVVNVIQRIDVVIDIRYVRQLRLLLVRLKLLCLHHQSLLLGLVISVFAYRIARN